MIYLSLTWEFYSFADLQKPQVELDGKACAAVGQSSLMATYDDLFSQVVIVVNLIHVAFYGLLLFEIRCNFVVDFIFGYYLYFRIVDIFHCCVDLLFFLPVL